MRKFRYINPLTYRKALKVNKSRQLLEQYAQAGFEWEKIFRGDASRFNVAFTPRTRHQNGNPILDQQANYIVDNFKQRKIADRDKYNDPRHPLMSMTSDTNADPPYVGGMWEGRRRKGSLMRTLLNFSNLGQGGGKRRLSDTVDGIAGAAAQPFRRGKRRYESNGADTVDNGQEAAVKKEPEHNKGGEEIAKLQKDSQSQFSKPATATFQEGGTDIDAVNASVQRILKMFDNSYGQEAL